MPGKSAPPAGRWLLLFILMLATVPRLALAAPAAPPSASARLQAVDSATALYFPETGFWVTDSFLSFWNSNGGLRTFGYPLSRVFYQDGIFRQYFERAIFERHDENNGTPYNVLLTRLGALQTVDRRGET